MKPHSFIFICLYVWLYISTLCACNPHGGQKASDTLNLQLQTVVSQLHGYWELNVAPLEEPPVYLPTKPPFQPTPSALNLNSNYKEIHQVVFSLIICKFFLTRKL